MITPEIRRMLEKEQKEINEWGRTVTTIYYTWYTIFLTVSAAALGWAYDSHGGLPSVTMGAITFIIFSALGVVAAFFMVDHTKAVDERIRTINLQLLGGGDIAVHSPLPTKLAIRCYWMTGSAMLC
jgi:hypothetical protein